MHKTNKNCVFKVQSGKVYCKTHKVSLTRAMGEQRELDENDHKGHKLAISPMQHILYMANYCITCNDGVMLLSEDQ